MRWILLALLGAVLTAIGALGLVLELAHGNDIWRLHNWGIALLVPGVWFVWKGLSERASGGRSNRPIWPGVILFAVLTAIAVALFAFAPPLAVLFLIIVLPFGWVSWVEGWVGRD
jgi:hypothetical protein